MWSFFAHQLVAGEEAGTACRSRSECLGSPARPATPRPSCPNALKGAQGRPGMRCNGPAALVSRRARPQAARSPLQCAPAADAGGAGPKAGNGLTPHRAPPPKPGMQIQRRRLSTCSPASRPAGSLNQIAADSGIIPEALRWDADLAARCRTQITPGQSQGKFIPQRRHRLRRRYPRPPGTGRPAARQPRTNQCQLASTRRPPQGTRLADTTWRGVAAPWSMRRMEGVPNGSVLDESALRPA